MKPLIAAMLIGLYWAPALAQPGPSADAPTAQANQSTLHKVGVMLRAMEKGYEFYMEHGNLPKADDYLDSIVSYTRYQSTKVGLTPEQLFVSAGVGTAQTWRVLAAQSATLAGRPRGNAQAEDDPIPMTNCHRDSADDFSCMTIK